MSAEGDGPRNLEQLLDRVTAAAEGEEDVSLGDVVHEVGDSSFGAVLLLAGLITLAPLVGDIPGVPTTMAILVFLTAGQMLLRRKAIWLPGWLLDRSVDAGKLEKGAGKLVKPARAIDRILKPRLRVLVSGPGATGVAVACLLIAAALPPMELIPFSANLGGAGLTAFGLALVAGDGRLALAGYIVVGAIAWILLSQL